MKLQTCVFTALTMISSVNAAPVCINADSDLDGDGWGWENGESCALPNTASNTVIVTPTCQHSTNTENGWGWENGASCVAASTMPPTTQAVNNQSAGSPDACQAQLFELETINRQLRARIAELESATSGRNELTTNDTVAAISTTPTFSSVESSYQALYPDIPESLNILFIGNSYMAYVPTIDGISTNAGPLSQLTSLMSRSGINVNYTLNSIGGGTLKQHWELGNGTGTPRGRIESGNYDLIIMQGRYDIHESEEKKARFDLYVDQFASLARQTNTNVALFGLWSPDDRISPAEDAFGPAAHDIYRNAAQRNSISYAPNGMAYRSLYQQLSNILSERQVEDAMTADEVHPTTALSYLAANVVYYTLFGIDSPTLNVYWPTGVSNEIGIAARSVATQASEQYGFNWR